MSHVVLGLQRDVAATAPLFQLGKGRNNARHVALGMSQVALGFQRDMAQPETPSILRASP